MNQSAIGTDPELRPSSSEAQPDVANRSWWSRECGGRDVMRLAMPLVISTMSWTIMNFVDRMFLLWHSSDEMAAATPAGLLVFTFMCFPLGVASFANTFVAQYEGSQNRHRVGRIVWQGVWIGVVAAPLFMLTIPFAAWVYRYSSHPPEVQLLEMSYYRISCWGAGAAISGAALSSFFTGRGQTRVVMCVDGGAAILNMLLDYAFIFGKFGASEMGIAGAAWATVISIWLKTLVFGALIFSRKYEDDYHIRRGLGFDGRLMRRLFYFGSPEGLRMFVEISALTGFLLLVGGLGHAALAATTLAFNINSVAFIPLIGMGIAVSTMVGQQLGENREHLAARATITALVISLVYTVVVAVLYLGFPNLLLKGHSLGTEAEDFADLRHTTIVLLRFVAAYCTIDAVYIIFLSAIKGAGDTRFVLVATILLAPIPVVATWVGLRYLDWGLIGCWFVLTVWVTMNGIVYGVRYWQGRWRRMRVIEPELI